MNRTGSWVLRERIAKRQRWAAKLIQLAAILFASLVVSACTIPQLPAEPQLPSDWREMPELLRDLQLPDLSQIGELPSLADLPILQQRPGVLVLNGPVDRTLQAGDRIPGTDIILSEVGADQAEFSIAGMRSVRRLGDSLDYDGGWPGLGGVTYALRLRIYRISGGSVRAAGVHQLEVRETQPQMSEVPLREPVLRFPYTVGVNTGERIAGTTYGYVGEEARGAQISGLAEDSYPYRKIGDSLVWQGTLRPDIPVEFSLRILYYGGSNARVGGIVALSLPRQ
jgi:hypothetical protein